MVTTDLCEGLMASAEKMAQIIPHLDLKMTQLRQYIKGKGILPRNISLKSDRLISRG